MTILQKPLDGHKAYIINHDLLHTA